MVKRVALIVGASSGFGLQLASELLKREFIVYAAARRLAPMEVLSQQGAKLLVMDVSSDESVSNNIQALLKQTGRIDIVFNNAGYGVYGAVEDVGVEEAQRQFDVNVFGLARVNRAVLPVMRQQKSGRIIVSASLSSHISTPGTGWYAASKHALKALCEALRMEVASMNIDVVQIEPGPVKTGFEKVAFEEMDGMSVSEDYRELNTQFRGFMENSYARAPSANSTINAMVQAATSAKPRKVYRTTFEAKVVPVLRQLLGLSLYSFILMALFRKHKVQSVSELGQKP